MYRIIYNSLKLQNTLGSPPFFRAISKHLCSYFNQMYSEYVLPSSPPTGGGPSALLEFSRRDANRKVRLAVIAGTKLSKRSAAGLAAKLKHVAENGQVDALDKSTILPAPVKQSLLSLAEEISAMGEVKNEEEPFIGKPVQKIRAFSDKHPSLAPDMSRILGKFSAPIYEFVVRGIDNCSCVWAIPFRSVWARANRKEPFLPGTVISEIRPPSSPRPSEPFKEMMRINESRIPATILDALKKREVTCLKVRARESRRMSCRTLLRCS